MQESQNGSLGSVQLFVDAWTKYDRNAAECIPISRFVSMMQDAPWPFGLQHPSGERMTNGEVVRRLRKLNIPVYVVPLWRLRRQNTKRKGRRGAAAGSPSKRGKASPVASAQGAQGAQDRQRDSTRLNDSSSPLPSPRRSHGGSPVSRSRPHRTLLQRCRAVLTALLCCRCSARHSRLVSPVAGDGGHGTWAPRVDSGRVDGSDGVGVGVDGGGGPRTTGSGAVVSPTGVAPLDPTTTTSVRSVTTTSMALQSTRSKVVPRSPSIVASMSPVGVPLLRNSGSPATPLLSSPSAWMRSPLPGDFVVTPTFSLVTFARSMLLSPLSRMGVPVPSRGGDDDMPIQVVAFHETLKCIAKVVVELDVDVSHPPPVGYAHEWFSATLIQKIVRGKLHRKAAAARAGANVEQQQRRRADDNNSSNNNNNDTNNSNSNSNADGAGTVAPESHSGVAAGMRPFQRQPTVRIEVVQGTPEKEVEGRGV